MSKHKEVEINLDKPYEEDVINFSGIIYFGVGLFLLIVVTFVLMWILQYKVIGPQKEAADIKRPMEMTADEKLPPEPRLQSAPGFGIDTTSGRVNLELTDPKAEWEELKKQNENLWQHGELGKDGKTVIALPINEAKARLLKDGEVKSVGESEAFMEKARSYVSGASAGRVASEKRR